MMNHIDWSPYHVSKFTMLNVSSFGCVNENGIYISISSIFNIHFPHAFTIQINQDVISESEYSINKSDGSRERSEFNIVFHNRMFNVKRYKSSTHWSYRPMECAYRYAKLDITKDVITTAAHIMCADEAIARALHNLRKSFNLCKVCTCEKNVEECLCRTRKKWRSLLMNFFLDGLSFSVFITFAHFPHKFN